MPIFTETKRNLGPRFLEDFPAPFGQGFAATFKQSVEEAPLLGFDAEFERLNLDRGGDIINREVVGASPMGRGGRIRETVVGTSPLKPLYSMDEANERGKDLGLTFEEDITVAAFEHLQRGKREELVRQSVIRRSDIPIPASFLASFLGQAIDPLNIAVSFIPVVGEVKLLAPFRGVMSRRLAKGAVEGFQGAVLVEPLVYHNMSAKQADYTMADSLLNVGIGTVLGSGLHTAFGKLGDFHKKRKVAVDRKRAVTEAAELIAIREEESNIKFGNAERVEAMGPKTREQALRAMTAEKLQGRVGDIEDVVSSDAGYKNPYITAEERQRVQQFIDLEAPGKVESAAGRALDPDQKQNSGGTSSREAEAVNAEPFPSEEADLLETHLVDEENLLFQEISSVEEAGGDEALAKIREVLGIVSREVEEGKARKFDIPEIVEVDEALKLSRRKAEAIRMVGECLNG